MGSPQKTMRSFDVAINFLTAYRKETDGELEYEMRLGAIAAHYARGWLTVDLVSSIPFDLFKGNDDVEGNIPVLLVGVEGARLPEARRVVVLVDQVDGRLRRGYCGVEELEAFLPDTHGDASRPAAVCPRQP